MSLALTLFTVAAVARGDGFVEHVLANGVRVSVLEVKEASKQTFFAFLPLGLARDDQGRTQFAHLLEHMLIRSVDVAGLNDGEIVFNGETSDACLRLDVHAPPKLASRAAAKLCRWLKAREFDDDTLAREKQNIAGEIGATSQSGYTHKWATAAWWQAARHGAKNVAVRGDVDRATSADVASYAAAKIVLGGSIRIVAVGPLAPADLKALFEAQFASDKSAPKAEPAPKIERAGEKTTASNSLATGELAATWDLANSHLLEWYLLPDRTPADKAAAFVVANELTMRLQSDPELAKARVIALASPDVVTPQGRVLLLSASLQKAADRALAQQGFHRVIDQLVDPLPGLGAIDQFLVMAKSEMAGLPDFAALRKQWAGRPNADLLEAQMMLGLAAREWSAGVSFAELGEGTRQLDVALLKRWKGEFLDDAHASRLLLMPAR